MTSVLKMVFEEPTSSKKMTWTLADPKTNINQASVAGAMMTAIEKEIPIINGETSSVEISDAYIYQTNKVELA